MSNDKPFKIENLDEVLAKVPPEDREALKTEIAEMFADFDPNEPPGEPVLEIPAGTTHCPKCGTRLEEVFRNRKVGDMPPFDLLACRPCDDDFVAPTLIQ